MPKAACSTSAPGAETRNSTKAGHIGPALGQHSLGRSWPNLRNCLPKSVELGPSPANLGQSRSAVGQPQPSWPKLGQFCQHNWSMLGRRSTPGATVGQLLGNFGATLDLAAVARDTSRTRAQPTSQPSRSSFPLSVSPWPWPSALKSKGRSIASRSKGWPITHRRPELHEAGKSPDYGRPRFQYGRQAAPGTRTL